MDSSRNRVYRDEQDGQIEDELNFQKYEDFHTIDWVQDALLESSRRQLEAERSRRLKEKLLAEANETRASWRVFKAVKDMIGEIIIAGQSWFIYILVGGTSGGS
jgi:hypothetical protein